MSYTLKGNSNGRSKIEWPVRLQARVIQLSQTGHSAKESFRVAVEEYNGVEGHSPITLPASYTNNNAGSVLWGMKKRFNDRLVKEDKATVEVAIEMGIIEEKVATTTTV